MIMKLHTKLLTILITLLVGHSYSVMECDTVINNRDTLVACKVIDREGNIIRHKKYLNGEFHGEQKEWFPDGTLRGIRNYEKGCLTDTTRTYYRSGKLESIIPYSNCKPSGVPVSFYENGDTASVKIGNTFRSYFENGEPSKIITYNDSGKPHGLSQTWREDGTRKDSTVYE
ncbi:MAG: hypothetical protein GF350_13740, partial [Chitinivibrionales bacterium]|nr:hypothetical protein [Chitinivibrionales bacterium]